VINCKLWCENNNIQLQFIQSGKSVQNAFVERNNGWIRRELLDAYHFFILQEVRLMTEEWRQDYNSERPYETLVMYFRWNTFNPFPF
jgi:putative transposase